MHSPALFCIFSLLPQLISVGGMKAIGSGIQLNSAVKQSTLGPISIAVKPVQTGNGGQKVFSSSGNLPFKGDISKLSSSSSLRASRKEIEPILENNQQPFHAKKSNSKIDEKKVAERIEKFMDGLKEGFFTVNDSLDVHYVTGGDAASENVILFVHGFPENSFAWRHQMQHFRTNSIVYAIDLVGFGKSSKPHDSLEYTVDEHVEDIAKVVEKLKAEHKGKKITLVSHDIGAVIGCGFNYKYPKMVDRFVMMNAPNPKSIHHMRETGTLDIGKLLKTHYIHKLFGFLLFPIPSLQMQHNDFEFLDELYIRDKNTKVVNIDGKTFDEVDLEVYKQTFRQPGAANSALNFFRAPGAKAIHGIEEKVHDYFSSIGHWWAKKPSGGVKKEETAKLTKKIETKTLIIWGMDDTVFGVEFANGAKHECEHAKLIKLEHCSHWVQQDRPDDVNSHIGKFIKGDYDHELN